MIMCLQKHSKDHSTLPEVHFKTLPKTKQKQTNKIKSNVLARSLDLLMCDFMRQKELPPVTIRRILRYIILRYIVS